MRRAWGLELGCGDIVGVGVERIFSRESCKLVLIVFCMLGDVVTVVVERFFDLDPMIVNMGGIRSYLTDKCECLSVDVVVMVMFVLNLSAERNRKDLTLEYNKAPQDIIYNYKDVGVVMVAKEGSDLPLQTNPELSENPEEELNDSDSCQEAAEEQCDEKNPTCKMNHQQNLKKVLKMNLPV